MNIGIIYLSLSGTTELIAREIKRIDPSISLIPIQVEDKIPKYKWRQILKYGAKTIMNRPIRYQCDIKALEELDGLIIGSPIWVGRIPSPIRDIISELNLKNKRIAAFCTFDTHPGDFKDQLYAFTDSELFSAFFAFKEPVDIEDITFNESLHSIIESFG